jgi:hypothetical protein
VTDENLIDDPVGSDDLLLGTASGGPSGRAGNHAAAQGVSQDTASGSPSGQAGNNAVSQGTTSGGPGGQAGNNVVSQRDDAVAAQLASMASAINALASRYEATQSEVGALRAEVAASRTFTDTQTLNQSALLHLFLQSQASEVIQYWRPRRISWWRSGDPHVR